MIASVVIPRCAILIPLGFVAGRTALASAIGLGLVALPELVLPLAIAGTGFSALQAASYWNPSDPWEAFKRGEGILGTMLGVASLPLAGRTTSDALLNRNFWNLAKVDPLFHPDVVYPQIQRGFLGQMSEDFLATLGFYPQADNYIETVKAYRFADRRDTGSLLPRVYKNPIMRPVVALGMKFKWFRNLRAELHSDGVTFASPYVSLGTDLQAMLGTRDEWLQSIMTGIPNSAQRAPDIGIFNIPVNRITHPRFTVGVRESEIMFRGNDLLKFLIEWNENPYGKTNAK